MHYVYILRSKTNNNVYIGSTSDLKRRFKEHATGQCGFTKPMLPVELEAYIAVKTEEKARSLEKYFKSGSGRAVLNKRILFDEASA